MNDTQTKQHWVVGATNARPRADSEIRMSQQAFEATHIYEREFSDMLLSTAKRYANYRNSQRVEEVDVVQAGQEMIGKLFP